MSNSRTISIRVTDEQKDNIDIFKEIVSEEINVYLSIKDLIIYALNELSKEYDFKI